MRFICVMSNYHRRDARLERIAEGLRTQPQPRREPDLRCHCGAPAKVAVSKWNGSTFFCAEHEPTEL